MAKLLSESDERRLVELYGRRSQLRGEELETLCRLVIVVLSHCHAPELAALREGDDLRATRERYIQEFLLVKILDTERFSDSRLDSTGVLVGYFRKLLINAINSTEESLSRDAVSLDEEHDEASDSDMVGRCGMASAASSSPARWLNQAREFADALEARYQVLLLSYCADEAVFAVAKRYNIASAAHHAGKLGITKPHGGPPADYGKTLIGRWLTEVLHIRFDADHVVEIQEVFEALCAASFELKQKLEAGLSDA